MLVSLGILDAQQSQSTEDTARAVTQLLNYCAKHPNATVFYHATDMVLHVESDVSYLSESNARSCSGGHFSLVRNHNNHTHHQPPQYL